MSMIRLLDEAQLAALLISRLCHDLISPVGAINNALELYDDDATMRQEALELLRASAANASARLQFARMAFGASGALAGEIDSNNLQAVASLYMGQEKASLVWTGEALSLPKIQARLLLNLLLVANASLPRGGVIEVVLTEKNMTLAARGAMVKLAPKFSSFLSGETQPQEIDAHSIQFYYSCLLADLANMTLDCKQGAEEIILMAKCKEEDRNHILELEQSAIR